MSAIIEKLDSYNILTNLLPGAFFCIMFNVIFGVSLASVNTLENVVMYYFAGLIIGRLGSLFIPKILINLRFVSYASRKDYVKAVKNDTKIAILSEASSYYRSLLACNFLLLLLWISSILPFNWDWINFSWRGIVTIPLVILFLFAFRKQNLSVSSRVSAIIELDEETEETA